MPRLAARDVAHAATTDHRILAHPSSQPPEVSTSERGAQAWREPPAQNRRRDLALAEIEAARNPLYRNLGVEGGQELSALPLGMLDSDASSLAALASVRHSENNTAAAVELFRRAARIQPSNASLAFYLGTAAKQNGDTKEAIDALRRSIELDPSIERAYGLLVSIYISRGDPAEAKLVRDLYLKWNRQSILGRIARENLDVWTSSPQSR
jgi:Flp pilus assembly protein TadD